VVGTAEVRLYGVKEGRTGETNKYVPDAEEREVSPTTGKIYVTTVGYVFSKPPLSTVLYLNW
jgi:hypothetical protein